MMKKLLLVAGMILALALTGSAFANEEDQDAQLALAQQCSERADDAGLDGEEREAFISSCLTVQEQKPATEEG